MVKNPNFIDFVTANLIRVNRLPAPRPVVGFGSTVMRARLSAFLGAKIDRKHQLVWRDPELYSCQERRHINLFQKLCQYIRFTQGISTQEKNFHGCNSAYKKAGCWRSDPCSEAGGSEEAEVRQLAVSLRTFNLTHFYSRQTQRNLCRYHYADNLGNFILVNNRN
jgi:hypothetical protein